MDLPLEQPQCDAVRHGGDGRLVAVSVSAGGVPKRPIPVAHVSRTGILGDRHAHEKHNRSDRALSLIDVEILRQLAEEGFPLEPGTVGENLTVEGLQVQRMPPGTVLRIGELVLRLEQPRKPCYVLDAIDPALKDAIVGRCGYMASVLRGGAVRAGMLVHRVEERSATWMKLTELRSQ
ncbi:MAG TPA: MOSC domain-containing protein [Pirellulales bacterium]|nr:MOSC domain-containing protein [Pirellulales bacterium]